MITMTSLVPSTIMVTCLFFFMLFNSIRVTSASFVHPRHHDALRPPHILIEGPHQQGQDAQIISSSPFFLNQMSNVPPSSSSSSFYKRTATSIKQSSSTSNDDPSFILRQQESNDPSTTRSSSTNNKRRSSALRKTLKSGMLSLLKPFTLSKKEVALNVVQLFTILLISRIFMILPTAQKWLLESKFLSALPQSPLAGYETMSFEGWISHATIQVYGLSVLLKLLSSSANTKAKESHARLSPTKEVQKRRSFGMIFGINQIIGMLLIISHMFIGNSSPMHVVSEQRLFNLAMYLNKVSTFLIGFVIHSPIFGWVALLPISILSLQKHVLDSGTLFGIILSTFGLVSMMTVPNNTLPLLFKISYLGFPLINVASTQVLQSVFRVSLTSDIRHVLLSSLLTLNVVFMRWTLIIQEEEEAKAKQKT